MTFVNHGAPVRAVRTDYGNGTAMTRIEHEDGVENHDQLADGERCACGALGLGIIRAKDDLNRTNDFHYFMHEFNLTDRKPLADNTAIAQAPRGGIAWIEKPPAD